MYSSESSLIARAELTALPENLSQIAARAQSDISYPYENVLFTGDKTEDAENGLQVRTLEIYLGGSEKGCVRAELQSSPATPEKLPSAQEMIEAAAVFADAFVPEKE